MAPEAMVRATTPQHEHEHNSRGQACTAALQARNSDRPGVFCVEDSGPSISGHFTAAVITEGHQVDGLSVRADTVTQAEEVAIALAASHQPTHTILTDSRLACSRYIQGSIALLAVRLLWVASWRLNPQSIRIVWTPGRTGLPGNEAANSAARASLFRAAAPPCPESDSGNASLTRYRDILYHYRTSRRLYPDPARGLAKANERLLRGLQTKTFLSLLVTRQFMPEISGTCPTWQVLADTFHAVASYPTTPLSFSSPCTVPTRETWEEYLLGCSRLEAQRSFVACAHAAAISNDVPD